MCHRTFIKLAEPPLDQQNYQHKLLIFGNHYNTGQWLIGQLRKKDTEISNDGIISNMIYIYIVRHIIIIIIILYRQNT